MSREASSQAAGLCVVASLSSIYVFLALPERFQDMITQQVMSVISGVTLFGYAVLESVEPAACYGALAATLIVILAAVGWQYYRHTHKSLPPLDVLLGLTPPTPSVDGPSTQGKAHLAVKMEVQSPVVAQVAPEPEQAGPIVEPLTKPQPIEKPFTPLAFTKVLAEPDLEFGSPPPQLVTVDVVQNPLILSNTGSMASTGGVDGDFSPLDDDGRLDYNNIHSALTIIKNKRAAKHADKTLRQSQSSGGSLPPDGSLSPQGEGASVTSPARGKKLTLRASSSGGVEDLDKQMDDIDAMTIGQAVRTIKTKTHRARKSMNAEGEGALSPSAQP